MNIHVSDDIIKKHSNMEFIGTSFMVRNKKVIRAKNHVVNQTYYYSFDEDFFWISLAGGPKESIPEWYIN